MKVEQITIFLENQSGRLADVASILAAAGVNIRALSLADSADFGILRLIVHDTEKASQVLKAEGFTVAKTEVVGVQVPDRPGGLASVLQVLEAHGLSVEYMYAFSMRAGGDAVMVFRFDDMDRALAVLQAAGVSVSKPVDLFGQLPAGAGI